MSLSVHETSYVLVRDVLRGGLLAAVGSGDEDGGVGSPECRASAGLYALLGDHAVDRGGRCRSCRGPRDLLWRRRRLCRARHGPGLLVPARRRAARAPCERGGTGCRAARRCGPPGRLGCRDARGFARRGRHRRAGRSRRRTERPAHPAATDPAVPVPATRRHPTVATAGPELRRGRGAYLFRPPASPCTTGRRRTAEQEHTAGGRCRRPVAGVSGAAVVTRWAPRLGAPQTPGVALPPPPVAFPRRGGRARTTAGPGAEAPDPRPRPPWHSTGERHRSR